MVEENSAGASLRLSIFNSVRSASSSLAWNFTYALMRLSSSFSLKASSLEGWLTTGAGLFSSLEICILVSVSSATRRSKTVFFLVTCKDN